MKKDELLEKSKVDFQENKKFFAKLKKKNSRELDAMFHQEHERVFKKTDCLSCANCCKTTSPIFRDVDIKRISKKLRFSESQFINKYLRIDEDKDYVLTQAPCPFLDNANYCSIYEDRPLACREYPHTDRKNMYQILDLTHKNTLICPAVVEIVEKIKQK
jgi:Fe-S-cluster containining protein